MVLMHTALKAVELIAGFEPATFGLQSRRSTSELYQRAHSSSRVASPWPSGNHIRSRPVLDWHLRIMGAPLYLLSYEIKWQG